MALLCKCPKCDQPLSLPDGLDPAVQLQCPICQGAFLPGEALARTVAVPVPVVVQPPAEADDASCAGPAVTETLPGVPADAVAPADQATITMGSPPDEPLDGGPPSPVGPQISEALPGEGALLASGLPPLAPEPPPIVTPPVAPPVAPPPPPLVGAEASATPAMEDTVPYVPTLSPSWLPIGEQESVSATAPAAEQETADAPAPAVEHAAPDHSLTGDGAVDASLFAGDGTGGEVGGGFPPIARPYRRQESSFAGLRNLLGLLAGGLLGPLVAYYLLNYFGGPQFNFFKIRLPGVSHTYQQTVKPDENGRRTNSRAIQPGSAFPAMPGPEDEVLKPAQPSGANDAGKPGRPAEKIGRASCRERV